MPVHLSALASLAEEAYTDNPRPLAGFFVQDWRIEEGCGFFAARFYHPDGLTVVAFRGSDDFEDLKANVRIAANKPPERQLDAARRFLASARQTAQRLIMVGHSLGGALAQVLSAADGFPAVTFNAPGMREEAKTWLAMVGMRNPNWKELESLVTNYRAQWDAISSFVTGEHVGRVVKLKIPFTPREFLGALPLGPMTLVRLARTAHDMKRMRQFLEKQAICHQV